MRWNGGKNMGKKLRIVNIGISSFYDALTTQDCEAVQIDWHPPVKVSDEMNRILDLTMNGIRLFPPKILRSPRFPPLRPLCKIFSSKSQKTPACYAPTPQGLLSSLLPPSVIDPYHAMAVRLT